MKTFGQVIVAARKAAGLTQKAVAERLRRAGVDDIILSCCYLPDVIEKHFGDGHAFGLKLPDITWRPILGIAIDRTLRGVAKNDVC